MALFEPAPNRKRIAGQAIYFSVWLTITVIAICLTPSVTGHGTHEQLGLPPCPSALLFSRPCPGCGLTTSWTAFVHGQFGASFRAHPFGAALYLFFTGTAFMALKGFLRVQRMNIESRGFNRALIAVALIFFTFGLTRMALTPNYRTPQDIAAIR